ncbi:hypothetical protein Fot_11500 [Forsythia ovata]|uniref:Uncharacterized protein n=1 Tax=Forsythia ovata TaxID=205694 RepID=A0ABD1WKJ2_9LAMI
MSGLDPPGQHIQEMGDRVSLRTHRVNPRGGAQPLIDDGRLRGAKQALCLQGIFLSVICFDHLFVKHGLMKKQGLGAKKIPLLVRGKEVDKTQKKTLASLFLESTEQTSNTADPKQATLAPFMSD